MCRDDVAAANHAPLQNKAKSADIPSVTCITECAVKWTDESGRSFLGLAEYLDQVIDGRPSGLAV
jgi:hypothetical protein